MIGLETRGVRPDPPRTTPRFLYKYFDHQYRLVRPTVIHEMLWGVPCGPTIPKPLLGLEALLAWGEDLLWEDD